MPVCVPIKDMKDTAKFTRTVEEALGPVIVTKNGYDAFVVMKSSEYDVMQRELAELRLLTRVSQAEREYASGLYSDGWEFMDELKDSHDL